MKVEPIRAPKFAALVKKYATGTPTFPTPVLEGCDAADPLAILLTNYLLWESTPALAEEALSRIARVVVDVNDLRVMLESEVREVIGEKYPFVEERAIRLRATLNDIFRRQHRTSLDHLRNASRKDQRAYLEGLAEIPHFVAGRTLLVAFELPAPIVDDTAVEVLHQNGVVEPTATTADVAAWIGKSHRIEELPKVHHALAQLSREAWDAAGRNGHRIRAGYLARHAGFRAAEEAERRRVEEEKLAKVREAERLAEEKRLAEVAREEERHRQKREAEEARVRARAEREAARVAAIAERERLKAQREAERVAREKQRALEAERKAKQEAKAAAKLAERQKKEAERKRVEAERKRVRMEAAARKAAALRAQREKKAAVLKAQREKQLARKQAAAELARRKQAQVAAQRAAKKDAVKKDAVKKDAVKATSKSSSKASSKSVGKSKPAKSKASTTARPKGTAKSAASARASASSKSASRKSPALKSSSGSRRQVPAGKKSAARRR
jgi:hypothetical protein